MGETSPLASHRSREHFELPDETVIDGEIVASATDVRPSFDVLQNIAAPDLRCTYVLLTC
jgi:ATP-dependent DNA ligase